MCLVLAMAPQVPLSKADEALYSAKAAGPDQMVIWTESSELLASDKADGHPAERTSSRSAYAFDGVIWQIFVSTSRLSTLSPRFYSGKVRASRFDLKNRIRDDEMKIFIGSSRESKPTIEWIAALIVECGHQPLPWYDPKAFPAGDITLPRLIELSKAVDAAILVFSEDDRMISRGTKESQPRDNVLLEYGLFVGALGPQRSVICTVGKPKIPVDVAGITYVNASNEHGARPRLKEWLLSIQSQARERVRQPNETQIGYFLTSEHERFTERVRDRLAGANTIVMLGSGLAILGRPAVVENLMTRAASGKCKVEIYMANPFSPAVETRLIEEEQGSIRPPDGQRGLLDRVATLLDSWRRVGSPKSVTINLCAHYPTFALIIVDDEYFVYPYSYRMLGNFSPVFAFRKKDNTHRDIVTFLNGHYERVKEDAIAAEKILEPKTLRRDVLATFAVYFVPRADSDFYKFGSEVIGYDVRSNKRIDTQWEPIVGAARNFGFHLTICDALYFHNTAEVRQAVAEVLHLAKELAPFELRNLKIKHDHPCMNSVAISVTDPSDELHCIHHELVQRIYRRAAASDYVLDQTLRDQYGGSDKSHMIGRYRALNILHRFQPHFTLLSNCGPEAWNSRCNELNKMFTTMVRDRTVTVARLAIMSKSVSDGSWLIKQEVPLGKAGGGQE